MLKLVVTFKCDRDFSALLWYGITLKRSSVCSRGVFLAVLGAGRIWCTSAEFSAFGPPAHIAADFCPTCRVS